jgi:hypothetical protein
MTRLFEGGIWRRDGVGVTVQTLAELHELGVEDAQLTLDPPFFGPLRDQSLHVAFRLRVA